MTGHEKQRLGKGNFFKMGWTYEALLSNIAGTSKTS